MLGIEELKGRVFQQPPTPKSPPPTPRERKLPSLKPSAMAHHHERKLHAKLSSLLLGLADSLPSPLPKSPTPRSPRTFDGGGGAAVGLAIVAAGDRAEPASIVSARAGVKWERPTTKEMEMEMSESYTCVISHVGGRPPSKRVYFDGGDRMFDPVAPPPLAAASVSDFLSCCGRCRKKLHGLDIFMYKGDKAFCSVECRYQQILSDEHMEQCGPGTMKAFDKSASPCPATLLFAPGVTAV